MVSLLIHLEELYNSTISCLSQKTTSEDESLALTQVKKDETYDEMKRKVANLQKDKDYMCDNAKNLEDNLKSCEEKLRAAYHKSQVDHAEHQVFKQQANNEIEELVNAITMASATIVRLRDHAATLEQQNEQNKSLYLELQGQVLGLVPPPPYSEDRYVNETYEEVIDHSSPPPPYSDDERRGNETNREGEGVLENLFEDVIVNGENINLEHVLEHLIEYVVVRDAVVNVENTDGEGVVGDRSEDVVVNEESTNGEDVFRRLD